MFRPVSRYQNSYLASELRKKMTYENLILKGPVFYYTLKFVPNHSSERAKYKIVSFETGQL